MLPNCNTPEENALIIRARQLMATWEDMAELIRLGAYKTGSDPQVDEAIRLRDALETFLSQDKRERATLAEGYARLAQVLAPAAPAPAKGRA
jgi:flagellum-specific ATP synthase